MISSDAYESWKLKREKVFWSKVDIKGPDDCWNYGGCKNKKGGYGIFTLGKRKVRAHRFAYESHHKCNISKDKFVLHKCDNPICCNPNHLYEGTQTDNMQDMMRRRRNKAINPKIAFSRAGFSATQIQKMRELRKSGHTLSHIASIFKMAISTLSIICKRDKYPCRDGYYI